MPAVVSLIDAFAEKKCTIVASRDCHSLHHCSFTTNGGAFPPHCVQGTKGFEVGVLGIVHAVVPPCDCREAYGGQEERGARHRRKQGH